jgi:hypothetical protein
MTSSDLTEANRLALAHVRAHAQHERSRHLIRIARVLAAFGVHGDPESLVAAMRGTAALTMNFHPDRLLADGRSVAQALYEEGVYRSQFETSISNGGLTAYPGGDRDRWEEALFGGAYQAPGVQERERPKYGGLNLMGYRNGSCPRFGSCHLRLRPAAIERATLIFGDSVLEPTDVAVTGVFEPVMAPLLESIAATGNALGRSGMSVRAFVEGLSRGEAQRGLGLFAPTMGHSLDDYIEAQVHGTVGLTADAEAFVIDPAFAGTSTGELLIATAERYGVAVEWHPGSVLALARMPEDAPVAEGALFAWQAFCAHGRARQLAERVIERHGAAPRLDAANIGQAAASVARNLEPWEDWGAPRQALQYLKYLWLILVAYGEPRP